MEIKQVLTDEAQRAYLSSMSMFLHVMKTVITGEIKNPIYNLQKYEDVDFIHKQIKDEIYPSIEKFFLLCDLINALESVVTNQSAETVKERLLRTKFFDDHFGEPFLFLAALEEYKKKRENSLSFQRTKIVLVKDNIPEESTIFIKSQEIFGTALLHETVLCLMLEKVLKHTRYNSEEERVISISHEKGILSMSGELRGMISDDWETTNLVEPDQLRLFHLLFSCIGIGKFSIRTESERVFVEFIYE